MGKSEQIMKYKSESFSFKFFSKDFLLFSNKQGEGLINIFNLPFFKNGELRYAWFFLFFWIEGII